MSCIQSIHSFIQINSSHFYWCVCSRLSCYLYLRIPKYNIAGKYRQSLYATACYRITTCCCWLFIYKIFPLFLHFFLMLHEVKSVKSSWVFAFNMLQRVKVLLPSVYFDLICISDISCFDQKVTNIYNSNVSFAWIEMNEKKLISSFKSTKKIFKFWYFFWET